MLQVVVVDDVVVVVVVVVTWTHGTETVWHVSSPSYPTSEQKHGLGHSLNMSSHSVPSHFFRHGLLHSPVVVVLVDVVVGGQP